jgi:arylsulfatase A-like enzyme
VLPGLVFHRPARGYSAYRSGDWKLVITWGADDRPARKELFDLSRDLGEQNNLAEARPERTAEMWGVLSTYLRDVNAEKVADFAAAAKAKKAKAGGTPKARPPKS